MEEKEEEGRRRAFTVDAETMCLPKGLNGAFSKTHCPETDSGVLLPTHKLKERHRLGKHAGAHANTHRETHTGEREMSVISTFTASSSSFPQSLNSRTHSSIIYHHNAAL